jgi:hypothetical protein
MKVPAHQGDAPAQRVDWLDLPVEQAEQGLNDWVRRARQADEPLELAEGLLWLGRVRGPQGLEREAGAALEEARAVARKLQDAALEAQIDISQAWNDGDFGHHARALAVCRAVAERARIREPIS